MCSRGTHTVYFATDGTYVKVGYTAQGVRRRLQALQTGNIALLHCFMLIELETEAQARRVEAAIRAGLRFRYKCGWQREWVCVTPRQAVAYVKGTRRWNAQLRCITSGAEIAQSNRTAMEEEV